MKTEFLWKDQGSNVGSCPSLSRVTEGAAGYVVVGRVVDAATRAQLPEVSADEVAVFVPANVIDRVRDLGR